MKETTTYKPAVHLHLLRIVLTIRFENGKVLVLGINFIFQKFEKRGRVKSSLTGKPHRIIITENLREKC